MLFEHQQTPLNSTSDQTEELLINLSEIIKLWKLLRVKIDIGGHIWNEIRQHEFSHLKLIKTLLLIDCESFSVCFNNWQNHHPQEREKEKQR
jgi:hypothetical protein